MERTFSPAASSNETPSTPLIEAPPQPTERTLTRFLRERVTLETLLYAAIFLAAVLTRFWDLGARALHHDESLHAYYSWLYAEGFGYHHDPMMHGPFLFHANALAYFLFGSTDYVSRVVPAVAGVIIVMLPWLLRGRDLLGRWGALFASALLLASPAMLYYSRFIRHDVYTLLGTFALAIAILRYVERPEPRWAILGGVAAGFLLCTKEVSFIVLFIFVGFLAIALALRVARSLFVVGAAALVGLGALVKLLHRFGAPPLPGIPWQSPNGADIWHFVEKLAVHPLVISALAVAVLALVAAVWRLDRARDGRGWVDGLLGDAPDGSTAAALRTLVTERSGLIIGASLGIIIFVVFYTSMFTNLVGVATGTFGALGYWLGQQGVQRGEQPWFYYLLLMPQYEFVAVLFFWPTALWVGWRWWRVRRHGTALSRRFYLRAFLIFWAVLMFGILSWAGEKMPWLVVHPALPMTLLAASLLGEAAEWIERRRARGSVILRAEMLLYGGAILGLLGASFLVMAWASGGPYTSVSGQMTRALRPLAASHWWLVYVPWLVLIGLLVYGGFRLGRRRISAVFGLTAALALVLVQVHTAWHVSYISGDTPTDMLVYVQSSPDVPQVTRDLEQLSLLRTGGPGLEVWFDSGTSWPFNWYLHQFPNRRFFGDQLPDPPNAPVILISNEVLTSDMEQKLKDDYTYQEYPMRWWFPEEQTYRRFAYAPDLKNPARQNYQDDKKPPFTLADVLGSVWASVWAVHEPAEQAKLFRVLAYREIGSPIGSYNFRVYVRNDLLREWYSIRYQP